MLPVSYPYPYPYPYLVSVPAPSLFVVSQMREDIMMFLRDTPGLVVADKSKKLKYRNW